MGTLSAQIAHIVYIGEEARTIAVKDWQAEYLTGEIIPWTQHVDILWPTIDLETQRRVLNQVMHLLKQRTSHNISLAELQQLLPPITDSASTRCQKTILGRIVSNPSTRDSVRIAALHHYADALKSSSSDKEPSDNRNRICKEIGRMVSSSLDPMRIYMALKDISHAIANELREAEAGNASVDSEARRMEISYLLGDQEQKALSLGLSLLNVAGMLTDDEERVEFAKQLLSQNHNREEYPDGFIYNVALSASLQSLSGQPVDQEKVRLGDILVKEFTTLVLLQPNVDVKLKTVLSINPYVLSQLSNLKKAFSRTYMMQLTQLLKRCQVAMLRDYIEYKGSITEEYDSLASDDKTITKLTELWMHLYVLPSCSAGVRETIARDQSHFNILISKPKLHVDKEVFGVIVDFWKVFYSQFVS